MKKLLAIILVLMLAFSTLLITACNKDNTADLEPETSSTQETTSTRHRGDAAGSGTTTPTSVGDTTTSTSDDNTTSSDDESGSSSSQKPSQGPGTGYENYDYTYQNTVTMPSEMVSEAGKFDMLICLFAEDFTKPQLTDAFYSALVDYESRYNKLSAVDKGTVKNYPFLQEARKAYNDMAKQECEKRISALPDASIDNLTDFGTQTKAIEKLLANLGNEANNIPNKNIYDNKVAKADSLLIDTFNQKVTALQAFEYTAEYKAKLDDADAIYSLMNTSQQSRVSASYSTLSTLKTKYADAAVAYSFVDTVNSLPDVNSLTDTDQAIIKQLKKTYNKMTDAEKAEIPAETKTKYEAYVAKAQQLWPENVFYCYDERKTGNSLFTFNGGVNTAGRADYPCNYNGTTYTKCIKFKTSNTVTFTTTKAGVLTAYVNVRNKSSEYPCDLILSLNGTEIQREALQPDTTGDNCEYTFPCNEPGNYTLSCTAGGEGAILYILVFS